MKSSIKSVNFQFLRLLDLFYLILKITLVLRKVRSKQKALKRVSEFGPIWITNSKKHELESDIMNVINLFSKNFTGFSKNSKNFI